MAVALPPHPDELIALPFGSFKRWLAGAEPTLSDVEGDTDRANRATPQTLLLRWDPESPQIISAAQARPGDTLILPAATGGTDQFGFNPQSGPVSDVAEAASAARLATAESRGRLELRLHPALLPAELAAQGLRCSTNSMPVTRARTRRPVNSPVRSMPGHPCPFEPGRLRPSPRDPPSPDPLPGGLQRGPAAGVSVTCFAADPAARKPDRVRKNHHP